MNTPPQGKISRLPHHLREQIHLRLRDGQKGKQIVTWLNSTPEVMELLATAFAGHPITQPNLSEWKKRHHPAWLLQQAALAHAARFLAESREIAQAGQGALTDNLATILASRYALAIRELAGDEDGSEHWNRLRALCRDVLGLRRSDQRAEWLRLNRERLEMQQSKNAPQNPMNPITPIPPIQAEST